MDTIVRQAMEAGGTGGALQLAPQVVLVPLLNMGLAGDMLGLAAHLTRNRYSASGQEIQPADYAQPRIVVLSVVEVPPDQPLTMGLDMARSYRALLDFLPSQIEIPSDEQHHVRHVRVDRVVKVARKVSDAICQAATEEHADLALLYWKGYAREPKHHVYGKIVDEVLDNPPCSVMLARSEGWHRSGRVLLPVRGGPTAEQSLDVGVSLAERLDLPLAVLHNVPRTPTVPNLERYSPSMSQVQALGEEPYLVFNDQLARVRESTSLRVESILTRVEDPVEAILAEAQPDDLIIMGLAPHGSGPKSRGAARESLPVRVSAEKGPPMLLLNMPSAIDLAAYSKRLQPRERRRGKAGATRWVDMPFERWFVEHTYHGNEFRDQDEFMRAKQESGLTLSVVVLTSNDAARVHSVITGLRRVLQELHPIADQILVVDAGSSDGTPDIARDLGVDVWTTSDILPAQGDLHGRGESWWKSLAVATGDIVVWMDPRAAKFHPSTALALAGPLMRVPTLKLVKAFSAEKTERRKQKADERESRSDFSPVDISWGGFVVPRRGDDDTHTQVRVQALRPEDLGSLGASQLALLPPRTLFQALCPSLAGVIAPFGKDMAARREAMMDIPVFTGDSLDIGLLLSVASQFGTNAVAQVELGQGLLAAPPQPGLRNAIDLVNVISRRLPDAEGRAYAESLAEQLKHEMEGKRGHGLSDAGIFEVRSLSPLERPPLAKVIA